MNKFTHEIFLKYLHDMVDRSLSTGSTSDMIETLIKIRVLCKDHITKKESQLI